MATTSRPDRRIRLAASTVIALAFVAAGCGDDTPAAAPTTTSTAPASSSTTTAETTTTAVAGLPKPCELVTADIAARLLPGATFQAGVEAGQDDNISCTYAGDPSGPTAQVEIFVGAGAKKSLEIDRDALAHEFIQPTGIGDEAWLEADNLFFRKSSLWVQLRVTTLDLEQPQIATNLTTVATELAANV